MALPVGDALAILSSPAIGGFWLGACTAAPLAIRGKAVQAVVESFEIGAVYGTMMLIVPSTIMLFVAFAAS